MFKIANNIIYLTRGDDATFKIKLRINNTPYQMASGDILTLKAEKFQATPPTTILNITSSTDELTIAHDMLEDIEYGKYDMEIQLTTADGSVFTIFPKKDALTDSQLLGESPWNNLWICREVIT